MASLLLAAGAPGMRHALPNARIMIHQPSGGVQVIIYLYSLYAIYNKKFCIN
jgi:hypothetical protein